MLKKLSGFETLLELKVLCLTIEMCLSYFGALISNKIWKQELQDVGDAEILRKCIELYNN